MKYFRIIFLFLSFSSGNAQLFRIAKNLYYDGVLLQMEPKRAHIWGYGTVGARIEIYLNNDISIHNTTVQGDAKWIAKLPPQPPGGPHTIYIEHIPLNNMQSKEIISIKNVTFGDIWLCAGEATMEFPLRRVFNSTYEMEKALTYTRLHLLTIGHYINDVEVDEIDNIIVPWTQINAAVVGDFSAICIFYGQQLSDSLSDRPIGLISMTWANTPIESWVSNKVINTCKSPISSNEIVNQSSNTAIWNGMIKPLSYFAIRGVIWSQGESNLRHNLQYYSCHLLHLTKSWRENFADGIVNVTKDGWAFPFGIVQTGTMEGENFEEVGLLRLHQTLDTQVAPNVWANETFMAPTYDLYDRDSPYGSDLYRDKQTAGKRLGRAARRLIYNETNLHFIGPIANVVWDYETSIMNASFTANVIFLNSIGQPSGFFYQSPTKEWISAPILEIYGDSLTFWVEPNYTHVAYAFSAVPCDYLKCNIYDEETNGLPHITMMFPPYGNPIP